MGMNCCCFEGVLGQNAKWIAGTAGKDFLSFNLGVSQGKKKDSNEYNPTLWLNCTSSSVSDKLVPYLGKGQKVSVIGKLGVPSMKQGKDGKDYMTIPLRVMEVNLLGTSEQQPAAGADRPEPGAAMKPDNTLAPGDIPF